MVKIIILSFFRLFEGVPILFQGFVKGFLSFLKATVKGVLSFFLDCDDAAGDPDGHEGRARNLCKRSKRQVSSTV